MVETKSITSDSIASSLQERLPVDLGYYKHHRPLSFVYSAERSKKMRAECVITPKRKENPIRDICGIQGKLCYCAYYSLCIYSSSIIYGTVNYSCIVTIKN